MTFGIIVSNLSVKNFVYDLAYAILSGTHPDKGDIMQQS